MCRGGETSFALRLDLSLKTSTRNQKKKSLECICGEQAPPNGGFRNTGGKNAVPTKGPHTISVESGNDSQRRLRTLVCMYFVDVDFYGFWGYLSYFRQIVNGKPLVMSNDLCHLVILEWVYQEEDGVHNGQSGG